ncbi:serine/threonine protein kinase [Salpingoeca rosetta]|uniref:Serine/threonine protein kinase n=1 Tax=Salpingoeca rosetta (strain ATCC 50818 / BSB-021) TaxID=946362 RepID=F2TX32_SALR5|nr:serine/threonine protein kinase [Salpingoeca rosetta]EGD75941.1 serine/threonine protein kinase [Salpingoeca rosetta]|eukprot:XP_004998117.1 serine/threonine protein kinase [Salpingoeca rosetta]
MAGRGPTNAALKELQHPSKFIQLKDQIGKGAYGKVFKGVLKNVKQLVAVKIVPIIEDEEDAIALELQVLANQSSHRNIARFYAAYLDVNPKDDILGDGLPQLWLTMQYCAYGSATGLVSSIRRPKPNIHDPSKTRKPGYLPEPCIAFIAKECLRGLEYLHSNKVIHRDIKGQNVLLTRDMNIKLVDFGVCALLQEQVGRRDTVIGTPFWMAPEVILCETSPPGTQSYDSKCDIWSLGITCIEIAEGHPPLHKMPAMKALMKIPNLRAPTLSSSHKWSKTFQDFVYKALQKNPKKRPRALELSTHLFVQSVDEVQAKEELLKLAHQVLPPLPDDDEPEWFGEEDAGDGYHIDTMLFDRSKKLPLLSKQTEYGDAVRSTDNLTELKDLDTGRLISILRKRYNKDVIYTLVGDILVALNPFHDLDIYTEAYHNLFLTTTPVNPFPHIFGVARLAYSNLKHTHQNQCCVISGESGAGKTETAKYFVRHILHIIAHDSTGVSNRSLEKRIQGCNPVLEAFGNAKTLMNENSSRFGKFVELRISPDMRILGATVAQYLLEKSRVCLQGPGERNFHVFYYVINGWKEESYRKALRITNVYDYNYLGGMSPEVTPDHDDDDGQRGGKRNWGKYNKLEGRGLSKHTRAKNMEKLMLEKKYQQIQKARSGAELEVTGLENMNMEEALEQYTALRQAMQDITFTTEEILEIKLLLAIVLHVGNIDFRVADNADHAVVFTPDALDHVANMIGVGSMELDNALTTNVSITRGETIMRRLRPHQARDARDGAAKALYNRLFAWIVTRINNVLNAGGDTPSLEIGVLDIFGFEKFKINSLEQLCINIANEQLQYFFNQHVFAWELDDLKAEGLKLDGITFDNNKPILDMFLSKMGMLSIIDEESYFPKANDQSLANKINTNLKKSRGMYVPPQSQHSPIFTINHYACAVTYSFENFLEKNRDTLSPMIEAVFCECGVPLIRMLFRHNVGATGILGEEWQADADRNRTATIFASLTPEALENHQRRASKPMLNRMNSSRRSRRDDKSGSLRRSASRKSWKRRRSRAFIAPIVRQGGRKNKPTICGHFKSSLADLMSKMLAARPHFVRCIKPNTRQEPRNFKEEQVTRQLNYTGLLATIKIRQQGYPVRLPFGEFVRMYQIVGFELTKEIAPVDEQAACVRILSEPGVSSLLAKVATKSGPTWRGQAWDVGKTKVFMKHYTADALQQLLEHFHQRATVIQAHVRRWRVRGLLQKLIAEAKEKKRREEEERRKREEERKRKEAEERKRKEEAERRRREEEERRRREEEEEQRKQLELEEKRKRKEEKERKKREKKDEKDRKKNKSSAAAAAAAVSKPPPAAATSPQYRKRSRDDASAAAAAAAAIKPRRTHIRVPKMSSAVSDKKEMLVAPFDKEEFKHISMRLVKKNKIPPGTSQLNRYMNILPNPRTRVRLQQLGEDKTTTYINANYIHGWDGGHGSYIATQGPKQETMADFWRMVWETNSNTIIMVTGLKEKGVVKCARYWPKVLYNEKEQLGDMQLGYMNVAVLEGRKSGGYVVTKIRLKKDKVKGERIVMHYWYNSWPDHGVPNNTTAVHHMLDTARKWCDEPTRPWVVHCSAGVGRTGTFITIDIGIRMLNRTGKADVNDIIRGLRRDRCAMVQHPEQAAFAHKALEEYAKENGVQPEPLVGSSDNQTLVESIMKAQQSVPPSFDQHDSQLEVDEGSDEVVPRWRLATLKRREEEEREEIMELEMEDDIGRRRAQRLRERQQAKEAMKNKALQRLELLEAGNQQALMSDLNIQISRGVANTIKRKLEDLTFADYSSDEDDETRGPMFDFDERSDSSDGEDTLRPGGMLAGVVDEEDEDDDDYLMLLEQEAEALSRPVHAPQQQPQRQHSFPHAGVHDYGGERDSQASAIVAQLPRRDETEWKVKPPLTWKPRHCADWLAFTAPQLDYIARALEDNQVHGAELLKLNDSRLKSIGVTDAKDRKAFKTCIKQLKSATRKGLEAGYARDDSTLASDRSKAEVYVAIAGFPGHPGRNQLAFREGDRFALLQEVSPDWYEMRLQSTGQTGMVPANYVQLVRGGERSQHTAAPSVIEAVAHVQAIADFKGAAGQLPLIVGEEFAVLQRRDANWLLARNRQGQTGLIPSTYVRDVDAKRKLLVLEDYLADDGVLLVAKGEVVRQTGWGVDDSIAIHTAAGHTRTVPPSVVVEHHPDYGFEREMEAVTAYVGGQGKLGLTPGDKIKALTLLATSWVYGFHPRTSTYGFVPISFLRDMSEETMPMTVIAPYDSQGQPGHVSVRVGQQVQLLKEVSADWCVVQVSPRERGLVPRGFLERARQESTTEVMRAKRAYEHSTSGFFLFEDEAVTVLQQSSDDWYYVRRSNGEEGMAPAQLLQPASVFFKAIADFSGQRTSSQLSFNRGDIFNLLSFKSNDWLQARNSDGRIGLVPAAYVEEVAPPEAFEPSRKAYVPPVEKGRVASRARVFSTPQSAMPTQQQKRESLVRGPSVHRLKSAFSRHALPLHEWTNEHVLDWLVTLAMDTDVVERVFRERRVDGAMLVRLTDRDLRGLGLKGRRTRDDLLHAIEDLRTTTEEKRAADAHPHRAPNSGNKSDSLRHRAASAGLAAQLNQLLTPDGQKHKGKRGKKDKQAFALELARKSMRQAERQKAMDEWRERRRGDGGLDYDDDQGADAGAVGPYDNGYPRDDYGYREEQGRARRRGYDRSPGRYERHGREHPRYGGRYDYDDDGDDDREWF